MMEPNTPLRLAVIIGLLLVNGLIIFHKEKFDTFDKLAFVWSMSYMAYYALKFVFGF